MTERPTPPEASTPTPPTPTDFLRAKVAEDVAAGRYGGRVATRFPPEPNGFLHIGHAKSIVLNFGVAEEYGGTCNLRFDDTNPLTEDMAYVRSIERDIQWLGYQWDEELFASDYFPSMYEVAVSLVRQGKAYVDDSTEAEIQEMRGTISEPGRPSPGRERSVEENLDLLERMRAGEFPDGSRVLRAKIDLAAANMKMRDPLLYRIRHAHHYRTGDEWPIYPMYDFAHCLEDYFEGITHSFCTLEFENNREIYDWILQNAVEPPHPQQIEFARLNLNYTVLSKRRLLELVRGGHVDGWDDPRMPTLSGLRRRGVTPEAIRTFCRKIGVAKANSVVDVAQLEHAIRDDLNWTAPRVLCVLDPLEVVVETWPEGETEQLPAPYWPRDVGKEGSREIPFTRHLFIERDDFAEQPPKGWRRLSPGAEVRLRYGYVVRCERVERDEAGTVTRLVCSHDPATRGGEIPDGRKVAGTIHWVSAEHAVPVEVRLYDRLFRVEDPSAREDYLSHLNPDSLQVMTGARAEPSLAGAAPGSRFQLERQGYFYVDPEAESPAGGTLVLNRTVTLRDTWTKQAGRTEDDVRSEERFVDLARGETAPTGQQPSTAPTAAAPAAPAPPRDPLAGLTAEQEAAARELAENHGLPLADAAILAGDSPLRAMFDEAVAAHANPAAAANWIVNDVLREVKDRPLSELPVGGRDLGELVALIDSGKISSKMAKEVFAAMVAGGGRPGEIVASRGLEQVDDRSALATLAAQVVAAHPDAAERYRAGHDKLLGFFVGQLMRETRGKANPQLANEVLQAELAGEPGGEAG
ncbi:MAG TPA: glutamine--tRNA ligase/YqeY domain fusion protein [Thermoanaerobaculia bacterium]|nr:glutamine--tRNA ligase/YqeY domain fusion protein [Thermoanaerobaculia bacterium]